MNRVYVFGAHSRGRTAAIYLEYESDTEVIGFLYDNCEKNEAIIDNKPVYYLFDNAVKSRLDFSCPVYIGTKGQYVDSVSEHLKEIGFIDIRPITVELDIELRTRFFRKYYAKKGLKFEKIDPDNEICSSRDDIKSTIFVAVSATDKKIGTPYALSDDEEVIQVGTECGSEKIDNVMGKKVALYDNGGMCQISADNRRLCELTGMYYLWKNIVPSEDCPDIIGFCHYRRHFLLPDNWEGLLGGNADIDVILPTPLYVFPSIKENFCFRHHAPVWEKMMVEIKTRYPECYYAAKEYFDDGVYSPCNMIITRKDIFAEFCEWLFPIEFALLDYFGNLEDPYQNRYAAFIAERLMSFYFWNKKDQYHIIYADKNFLK